MLILEYDQCQEESTENTAKEMLQRVTEISEGQLKTQSWDIFKN